MDAREHLALIIGRAALGLGDDVVAVAAAPGGPERIAAFIKLGMAADREALNAVQAEDDTAVARLPRRNPVSGR